MVDIQQKLPGWSVRLTGWSRELISSFQAETFSGGGSSWTCCHGNRLRDMFVAAGLGEGKPDPEGRV